MLWFTRGQEIAAPLVTSSAPSDLGLIGRPSTVILSGNRALGYGAISGARLTAGFYGDVDQRIGFQIQGFFTEHKPNNQTFGAVRNPYDPGRVAGGSSGGSAVAVAARLACTGVGTDTGGSIRLPSAVNGIVGIRPTYGRVSNHGIVPLHGQ